MKKNQFLYGVLAAVMVVGSIPFMGQPMVSYAKNDVVIDESVPNLKDAITDEMGDDFLVGCAICNNEIADVNTMALVTKHCNAVTFGNELKPDCMFNYSNQVCPGTEMVELHGEKLEVPVMCFDRAEMMLSYFYEYNQEHPDHPIRIRGHVLTWHSQTPEWFFHEDYDAEKPYVSKDEMTKRHEWYIKTVLEHFVGEDSIYKDMFYGWDVVNEAVSDSTGTYRNAEENSSWWAVYGSNEFIINAFRFANQYAPAELELYYNDYNDANPNKCQAIVKLLTDVKNADGTRIDGMGMQGHYQNTENSPSIEQFMDAARAYAAVVDKVQLTEMDFQASPYYDGTEKTYGDEDTRLAYRYKDFYDAIKQLRAEGINFSGITIWGVIDKNSWLQTASFVGGGSDGKRHQMPLLFDDDYQVKSAYWAFVDPSKLTYPIKTIDVLESVDLENEELCFENGVTYQIEKGQVNASFVPVWSGNTLKVKVSVKDVSVDETDQVCIYVDRAMEIQSFEIPRSLAEEGKNGYETVVEIPFDENFAVADVIRMDVSVTNGSQTEAFNDQALNQENSSDCYALATMKPYRVIPQGQVSIDGEMDEVWKTSPVTSLTIGKDTDVKACARVLWDEEALYLYVKILDSELNADGKEAYEKDSVEIMIDEKNQKTSSYQSDDAQYRINFLNETSCQGKNSSLENLLSAVKLIDGGYVVEAKITFTTLRPFHNKEIGLEIQVNDASKEGVRTGTLNWSDSTNTAFEDTSVFGTAKLVDAGETVYEEDESYFTEQTLIVDNGEKKKPNLFIRFFRMIGRFFKRLWKGLCHIFHLIF